MMIWSAIAVTLALRGQPDMAKLLLLGLGTYARPSELLGLRKQDVIPPVRGMSRYGAIIIAPEDVGVTTKTGETDDSVLLDCSWMPWLHTVAESLSQARASGSENLFDFDYPTFCGEFNDALAELDMTRLGVVPYAWRHSGPSIDRAQNRRTLAEVQKRGRWKQQKSVARYEKAGRLGMTIRDLTSEQVAFCEMCDRHLGDFICGRRTPLRRFRDVA